jgi:hypothetical protein
MMQISTPQSLLIPQTPQTPQTPMTPLIPTKGNIT